MELYKDLNTPQSQEFEQLLNNQLSKTKIEEGKIIDGKINKITEKFVFLFVEGLKSEPVLDINELKSMGLSEKIKVGETIPVLLERIEDKNGEVVVSASKAQKIKGWDKLVEAYEKNEPIMGRIQSKCKGGCIVEHIETGSLMFLPGSQISDKPLKDISHLMNEPQKFALIKLDKIRGNACVSRREIISSFKKEDKAKIIEKYKVGDIIEGAEVKGYSSFGCFFNVNNEIDCLVHLQEISYSRVNHPEEIFTIGDKHDLLVITVDKEKGYIDLSNKFISEQDKDAAILALDKVTESNSDGYITLAKLKKASLLIEDGRVNEGLKIYLELEKTAVDSSFRDMSTIFYVLNAMDILPSMDLIQKIDKLTNSNNPWSSTARELKAFLYLHH